MNVQPLLAGDEDDGTYNEVGILNSLGEQWRELGIATLEEELSFYERPAV